MGMEPDTKVGIQGSYKFTDSISGTAQILTKYRASGQYRPEFEWAFAKWQATPGLSLRAGRIGAPFFMVSDFRDVGYANTAVRPPLDVYGQVPVSSVDGGDVSYQTNLGSATVTGTLWGGYSRNDYASALNNTSNGVTSAVDPVTVKIKAQLGLNLQAEFDGGFAVRLGHSKGDLTIDSTTNQTLRAGLANVLAGLAGPAAQSLANQTLDAIATNNTNATFTGIGVSMDRDNIVLASEYTMRRIKKGTVADTTGWYVLGGYRFGSFLPYVVLSKLKVDDTNTSLPAGYTGLGQAGTAAAGALTTQYVAQRTTSVGVRWDAMRSAAVKLQFDRVSKPANSNGLFLVANPSTANSADFRANKKNINIISLAVDFVF